MSCFCTHLIAKDSYASNTWYNLCTCIFVVTKKWKELKCGGRHFHLILVYFGWIDAIVVFFFVKKRKRTSNALNVCNFRWNSLYFEWKTFSLYIKQLSQSAQCAQYGNAWFAWKWQGQTTHYCNWLSFWA